VKIARWRPNKALLGTALSPMSRCSMRFPTLAILPTAAGDAKALGGPQ